MTVLEEKERAYHMKIQGEEIPISDVATAFSSCWIYKACVTISDKVIAIVDIENNHAEYKTIIISKDNLPIVTKESTTDILNRYRKRHERNYRLSKRIIKVVFGKSCYLHGYIEKQLMFIPLEGESKGNVSYFNLTYIDSAAPYDKYNSVISFSNYLDIVVPKGILRVKKKLIIYLEHYIAYTFSLVIFNGEEDNFEPFKDWNGACYEAHKNLIPEIINKIDKDEINKCRVFNDIKYVLTDSERNQVMEDISEGTL